MFRGTLTQTSVYPREVVKRALDLQRRRGDPGAQPPSGVAEPSRADEFLTQTLKSALALVDVRVLDHLVVGQGEVGLVRRAGAAVKAPKPRARRGSLAGAGADPRRAARAAPRRRGASSRAEREQAAAERRERDLFASAVGQVVPLRQRRAMPRRERPRPAPRARQRERDDAAVLVEAISDELRRRVAARYRRRAVVPPPRHRRRRRAQAAPRRLGAAGRSSTCTACAATRRASASPPSCTRRRAAACAACAWSTARATARRGASRCSRRKVQVLAGAEERGARLHAGPRRRRRPRRADRPAQAGRLRAGRRRQSAIRAAAAVIALAAGAPGAMASRRLRLFTASRTAGRSGSRR